MEKSRLPLVEIQGLTVSYGNITALRDITLKVEKRTVAILIGANGAGKSTVLKTLLGLQRPSFGSIRFEGQDITSEAVDKIVSLGVVLVPEGRGILMEMSVIDNLELGAYHRRGSLQASLEKVFGLFPILRERRLQKAGLLSGGQQQMLAIGRALMAEPVLIMMDEPSLGLAPIIVDQVFNTISEIKSEGHTILLAEQNARKALQIADQGYAFEKGRIVAEGTSQGLREDDRVRKAYLGG